MGSRLDARASRLLLAAGVAAAFAVSAVSDLRALGVAGLAAALAFRAGAWSTARRVLRSVVPVTAGLACASWAWLRLVTGGWPDAGPFAAVGVRTVVIAFVTFAVLERVDLLRAVAPWPAAARLVVVTLAQVHALRLLATESLAGLRSRLPRAPRTVDVARGAGGITAVLFTLSLRNARDVSDAMRSRGFR